MSNQESRTVHRLEGLQPDNLLAFMALLGLLRALDTADAHNREPHQRMNAKVSWSIDRYPLRPNLHIGRTVTQQDVAAYADNGISILSSTYDFDGMAKLKLTPVQARRMLISATTNSLARERAELWAALVSDAAAKDEKVERTPFCLLDVAQTSFLKNLAVVVTSTDGRQDAIEKSAFHPWHWADDTPSFRWDPIEDTRHAYRASAPTDDKQKVEHGANILAAVGLPILTVVPQQRNTSVRLCAVGGSPTSRKFSFAWPIWNDPISLAAIRSLLVHPGLWNYDELKYLGVVLVMVTKRIAPSRYNNFTRARPLKNGTLGDTTGPASL